MTAASIYANNIHTRRDQAPDVSVRISEEDSKSFDFRWKLRVQNDIAMYRRMMPNSRKFIVCRYNAIGVGSTKLCLYNIAFLAEFFNQNSFE